LGIAMAMIATAKARLSVMPDTDINRIRSWRSSEFVASIGVTERAAIRPMAQQMKAATVNVWNSNWLPVEHSCAVAVYAMTSFAAHANGPAKMPTHNRANEPVSGFSA